MECFIAYNEKQVATAVKNSVENLRAELSKEDFTSEFGTKYLPGKYVITKVNIEVDDENGFKTYIIREHNCLTVKNQK
mgnify:CR=1 FL=1